MPEVEVEKTPETKPATTEKKPNRIKLPAGFSIDDVKALKSLFDSQLPANKNDPELVGLRAFKTVIRQQTDLAKSEAKIAQLQADLDAAKSAVPADHVVIPKADADLLEAYKAFGKPDAIKAAADELKASKESLAVVDKTRTLAAVARVAGVKNVALFNKILDDDIIFAPAKVKDDLGNDVDSFTATVKGPDGKPVTKSIQEMVLADWQPYIAALAVDPAAPPASRTGLPIGDTPYRPTNAFTGAPDANENGQPKYVNGNQIREQLAI